MNIKYFNEKINIKKLLTQSISIKKCIKSMNKTISEKR